MVCQVDSRLGAVRSGELGASLPIDQAEPLCAVVRGTMRGVGVGMGYMSLCAVVRGTMGASTS